MLGLSLLITGKCNISCSHCIFGTEEQIGPNTDMPMTAMQEHISAAMAVAELEKQELSVSFSGGEPFLRFPELVKIARFAKNLGVSRLTSMSNGFWGEDFPQAKQWTADLKAAGLTTICFSIDDFHQQYVPIQSVIQALQACREVGIGIAIKTTVTKQTRRLPQILEDLGDLLLMQSVSVEEIACAPVGSAVQNTEHADFFFEEGIPQQPCPAGTMLNILPDGTVFPCCGTGWTERLALGTIETNSVASFFATAKTGPLMDILRRKGPAFFLSYFDPPNAAFLERKYTSCCDLCSAVLAHPGFEQALDQATAALRVDWTRTVFNDLLAEETMQFCIDPDGIMT